MRFVKLLKFLSPGFKMAIYFDNAVRSIASTTKFAYRERYQIVRNRVHEE